MPSTDADGGLQSKSCDMLAKRPRTVFAVCMAFYLCALCVPYFNGANKDSLDSGKNQSAWVGQGIITIFALALALNSSYSSTSPASSFVTRVLSMPIIAPLKFGFVFFLAGEVIYSFGRASSNGPAKTCYTLAASSFYISMSQRCVDHSTLSAAGFFYMAGACVVGAGQTLAICRSGKDPDWLGSVGAKFTFALLWISKATVFFTWSGQGPVKEGESPYETGFLFAGIFALSAWILSSISAYIYVRAYRSTAGLKPTAMYFTVGLSFYSLSIMAVTWGFYNLKDGVNNMKKLEAALIIAGLFMLGATLWLLFGVYKMALAEKVLSHALFLLAFACYTLQQATMYWTVYEESTNNPTEDDIAAHTTPQAIFLLAGACCLCVAGFFLGKEGSEGIEADSGAAAGKTTSGRKKDKKKKDVKNPAKAEEPQAGAGAGTDAVEVREPASADENQMQKHDSEPSWMSSPEGNV